MNDELDRQEVRDLRDRIESALSVGGLRLTKTENNQHNCGLTPALTLALLLHRNRK